LNIKLILLYSLLESIQGFFLLLFLAHIRYSKKIIKVSIDFFGILLLDVFIEGNFNSFILIKICKTNDLIKKEIVNIFKGILLRLFLFWLFII